MSELRPSSFTRGTSGFAPALLTFVTFVASCSAPAPTGNTDGVAGAPITGTLGGSGSAGTGATPPLSAAGSGGTTAMPPVSMAGGGARNLPEAAGAGQAGGGFGGARAAAGSGGMSQLGGAAGSAGGGGFSGGPGGGGATTGGMGGTGGMGQAGAGQGGAGGEPSSSYSPCPEDGSPCAILPLGDSITFGEGSSGGGYRVELFRKAVVAGQAITFVGTASPNGPDMVEGEPFPRAHQGHQGYVIDEGGFSPTASLSLVLDDALPALDPHIVLLMIGTNDVNGNNALGEAPSRLAALVDKIAASEPDALIVVAQLTPTRDSTLNARIETYNAGIAPVVEQLATDGKHVLLVDMFTPFVETANYANALLADSLHPNDAGYAVMADVWYGAIGAVLPGG